MANKPPDIPVCGFSDEKCPSQCFMFYFIVIILNLYSLYSI